MNEECGDRRLYESKVSDDPLVVFFFVASWGLLGIGGFSVFYVGKNAAFKRRYFPWFAGLTGLLFVGIAASAGVPVVILGILLPFVALITYLSIRGTQFCSACGKTLSQEIPFSRAEFCSRCGAPLRDKGKRQHAP